ncbi:GIY-YIG nuclease family protein [bacterium]|nr:GIY-YIG nuclease family protein [bacterium]
MKQIEIIPSEPYSWANFKDFPSIDNSGIYFWSITYDKQQLIFYVGMTKNFKRRMNQHLESYTSGFYQVFDSRNFLRGIRKHVWIGKWRYNLALRNKDIDEETFNKALEEYELKKEFHEQERINFLDTMKLYFFPIPESERNLKRIETALALNICYKGGVGINFQEPMTVGSYFRELKRDFEEPLVLTIKDNIFFNLDSKISA